MCLQYQNLIWISHKLNNNSLYNKFENIIVTKQGNIIFI